MKSKFSKLITSILIIMLLFNFILSSNNSVYATQQEPEDVLNLSEEFNLGGMLLNGIVGILTTKWRVETLLIGTVFHAVGVVLGGSAGLTEGGTFSDYIITPEQIFFNKLNITSIDFFDFSSGTRSNEGNKNSSSNMVLRV